MGLLNSDLENDLETLPDAVADQLLKWRIATLDRERIEAILYAEIKGGGYDKTATEIKALIHANDKRYEAVIREVKAESDYNRVYERLMAIKKKADLRTAY